jgi:hypothetical protein
MDTLLRAAVSENFVYLYSAIIIVFFSISLATSLRKTFALASGISDGVSVLRLRSIINDTSNLNIVRLLVIQSVVPLSMEFFRN